MFAVFYKGEFINWWHNQKTDTNWIERTIAAMGWDKREVEVVWHDQRPSGIFAFDAEKNIKTYQKQLKDFEVDKAGKKEIEKKEVIVEDELPLRPEVWFDKGERKKNYDSVQPK